MINITNHKTEENIKIVIIEGKSFSSNDRKLVRHNTGDWLKIKKFILVKTTNIKMKRYIKNWENIAILSVLISLFYKEGILTYK